MFKLKAGKYWIGDPCYVYPDNQWSSFCAKLYDKKHQSKLPDFIDGMFVNHTAHGDGGYPLMKSGQYLGELGVDAGLLSIVPIDVLESFNPSTRNIGLGIIVEVVKDCEIETYGENGGNFRFGPFVVKTDWEDEDSTEY